jgi:hypothetical protein
MRAKLTIAQAKQPTETRPTFGIVIASLMKGLGLGVIAGLTLGMAFGWVPLPWDATPGVTSIFTQTPEVPIIFTKNPTVSSGDHAVSASSSLDGGNRADRLKERNHGPGNRFVVLRHQGERSARHAFLYPRHPNRIRSGAVHRA